MNPFGGLWLKRVVRHFSMKGGSVYDQSLKSLKGVCRSAESGGLLPPVRRSYGSRAGARTRIVRMALRQLRRTGRSGDPRPSPGGLCASRRRESLYQPREAAAELNPAPAGTGALPPPVHAGSVLHQPHPSQAGRFYWQASVRRERLCTWKRRGRVPGSLSGPVPVHASRSALIERDIRGNDAHT